MTKVTNLFMFPSADSHVRCVQVHRWLPGLHFRGTRDFSLPGMKICLRKMKIGKHSGTINFSIIK